MVYDQQALNIKYSNYANIAQKVKMETQNNNLVKIKRGLYSDDIKIDGPIIANVCYEPSYLSFEYALSRYSIIPEYVSVYTSACYGKKNNKRYFIPDATFEYKSVPDEVFPYGVVYRENEAGMKYKIATKEKALCDILYQKYPVRSIKDLKVLLFEDLRVDEEEFLKLDFNFIIEIAPLYHSNSLLTLRKYIMELNNNDNND